ncbi:MAG: hypothetical protein E7497_06835 [Ruminococcus sp.]|nr:hypothetical protein [Ruminococcus sp.]
MKRRKYTYRTLALAAAAAMIFTAGCSDKKDKNKNESDTTQETTEVPSEVLKQPLTFSIIGDIEDEVSGGSEGNVDLNAEDPTAPAGESSGSDTEEPTEKIEYILLTDTNGENVTEYVPVTDAQGGDVTDAEGEVQTEAVPVTTAVAVENGDEPLTDPENGEDATDAVTDNGEDTTEKQDESTKNEYKPKVVKSQAFWFDISKESDFTFNGEFISVKFRIKDDAPDGEYDITITNPDFASYNETTVFPDKVLNGKVYASENGKSQTEVTDADGFAVYADYVSGKQGDEVTVNFYMNGNPGMCAMIFEFEYDSNALEMLESGAVGEFAEKASPSL